MSAELAKLAHQLGVDEAQLGCVAGVAENDLRQLRRQIGEALFEADRHYFQRLANLAKAVPSPIAAKVSELVLPPLLAARTAELLDGAKAAEMVNRMSARYTADVAAAMDPARVPELVAAMPPGRVGEVTRELAGRREWIVMGAFVSFVTPEAMRAAVEALDGAQLLQIAPVLDDRSRLDELSGLLTDDQVDDLLDAVPALQSWAALDELVADLGPAQVERLRTRLATFDEERRAAFGAARLAPATREMLAG